MKTINVELKVNCPYGKRGDVVVVNEDTAKAYWDDMVKTDKKPTEKVDAVVSDVENTKTQKDLDAEAAAEKAAQEKEVKNKETKEVKNQETK